MCSPHVECDLDLEVETLLYLDSVYRDGKFTFPHEPLTDVRVNAIRSVLKAVLGVGE